MPRTLLLLLCLLLGPLATILIAWSARAHEIWKPQPRARQKYTLTTPDNNFDVYITQRLGRRKMSYMGMPAGWHTFQSTGDPDPLPLTNEPRWAAAPRATHLSYTVAAYGWPLHALRSLALHNHPGPSTQVGTLTIPAWFTPNPITLPISPIWPNFALASLFWSSITLAALAGIPALRRAHRKRHDRCTTCGYDLRNLIGPCPECGPPPP